MPECELLGSSLTARFCLANGNVATHPFDVLKIVNGLGFIRCLTEIHKGKSPLATGVTIKRHRAFGHLSVLPEKMLQVFSLSIPGEISNENGQKIEQKRFFTTLSHHAKGHVIPNLDRTGPCSQCALTPIAFVSARAKTVFIEIGGAHDGRHST